MSWPPTSFVSRRPKQKLNETEFTDKPCWRKLPRKLAEPFVKRCTKSAVSAPNNFQSQKTSRSSSRDFELQVQDFKRLIVKNSSSRRKRNKFHFPICPRVTPS